MEGRLDLECQIKKVGSGKPLQCLSWGVMCAHWGFRIMTGAFRWVWTSKHPEAGRLVRNFLQFVWACGMG